MTLYFRGQQIFFSQGPDILGFDHMVSIATIRLFPFSVKAAQETPKQMSVSVFQ